MTLRSAILAGLLTSKMFAASTVIGVVTASGPFQLEGSRIWGNSTLFEGARVEATGASSELKLSNGVIVQLASGSAARVWKNRLELERGTGQVASSTAFPVTAGGMTVEGSRFRVGLTSGARLEVAALSGSARVIGSRGALISSVPAGRNMSFAMQQAITRAGCLLYKGNGFILQVDDSPEVLQLSGGTFAGSVGNRVTVTGTLTGGAATISPATGTLNVTTLTTRATGGCLTAAAALGAQTTVPATAAPAVTPTTPGPAQTPAPIAKSAGMSTGAKVAIIGAIGGGAAGAAIALSGKKDSTSP